MEAASESKKESEGSSSSDESMDDEDTPAVAEEEEEEKLILLQKMVDDNIYIYDNHISLIQALRSAGELDWLRQAREKFSSAFPLTPTLWLEWIRDEINLTSSADGQNEKSKEKVRNLFERAISDYLSFDVWLEYAQWSCGEADFEQTREIFERGITAVGLQVDKGSLLWDAYRLFEGAVLESMSTATQDDSEEKKNLEEKQKQRILNIFRRQLSQPLDGIEDALKEYLEFCQDKLEESIQKSYGLALERRRLYIPLESGLASAEYESLKLDQYKNYIEFELKNREPTRIQLIYERAVTDNCLNVDLWKDYIKWLVDQFRIHEVTTSVCERATRNCPWAFGLWMRRLFALERAGSDWDKIEKVFSQAAEVGYRNAVEGVQLWQTYVYALRRHISENSTTDDCDYARVLDAFERGSESLKAMFGEYDWDPESTYRRNWAYFAASKCGNIELARKLWQYVLGSGHARSAAIWLDYLALERQFGTTESSRKLLYKAVNSVSDLPDTVCYALLQFENEEGTLADYDKAIIRVNNHKFRVSLRESQQRAKEPKTQQRRDRRHEKMQRNYDHKKSPPKPQKDEPPKAQSSPKKSTSPKQQAVKRVHQSEKEPKTEPFSKDSEGFAVPTLPPPTKKQRQEAKVVTEPAIQEDSTIEKAVISTEQKPATSSPPDTSKYDKTVFVSNLNFKLTEDKLDNVFGAVGKVVEIRLVRRPGSTVHRGFGYVQFETSAPVGDALKLDRTPIEGRPMFVSLCEDKQRNPTKFKYNVGLEKNKLFVRNVNYEATEEDLKDLFSQYGSIKQVRLVTHKDGKAKGCAYVEFTDQEAASKALINADNTPFKGRNLSVALSNPPSKSSAPIMHREDEGRRSHSSKLQLMAPRALSTSVTKSGQKHTGSKTDANGASNADVSTIEEKAKISNEQFRAMFLKK